MFLEMIEQNTAVSTGEVMIGGDWELTNQNGQTVTNKDFLGKWCIVYFGFTHCPDICPEELDKIVDITDMLGECCLELNDKHYAGPPISKYS